MGSADTSVGVLEVDGSSRYFFIIVTFTRGDEVRALPVEAGAGDNLTIVGVAEDEEVAIIVVALLPLLMMPTSFVLCALPTLPPRLLL